MKKWLSYGIMCVLTPAAALLGARLFGERRAAWLSLCVTILACIPFFLHFERKQMSTRRLILVAVMIALSVVGRMLFAPIPGFKPVTALSIITAMYFGPEAGFMTGALTAVISNFYFGQGLWTPFQMFCWGMIGLIAGLFANPLKKSRVALVIFGVLSGILLSFLLDIWTVLWADSVFTFRRYLVAITAAARFTATYAVSNVIFLLLFARPIGKILDRIKLKYDL